MNERRGCSRVFLISVIVVVGMGLFVIFPASHGMSALQVRQRDSGQQLRQLARIIAMCDSDNATILHTALTELACNTDRWVRSYQISECNIFNKLNNVKTNVAAEFCSSYVGLTNSAPCIVLTYTSKEQSFLVVNRSTVNAMNMVNVATIESLIVAHERLGLWPDDTVAVFFKQLGVVRMKTSDFMAVASGVETVLRFNRKKQYWESNK